MKAEHGLEVGDMVFHPDKCPGHGTVVSLNGDRAVVRWDGDERSGETEEDAMELQLIAR